MNKKITPPQQQNHRKLYRLLIGVAIVSILFNILAILPYVRPYYNKLERKFFPPEHFTNNTPDKEVLNKVCEATLKLKGVKMSMNECKGLPEDIIAFFKPKRNSNAAYNYYTAYALAGASYYAVSTKDTATMDELKREAARIYDYKKKSFTYDFVKIDQIPIGLFFLNLYKWYGNENYLDISNKVYDEVKKLKGDSDVIMYTRGTAQLSDVVGMYVPFLMEYFDVTKDSLSYQIADYNMKLYYEKGVDHETGIPFHGYNIENGLRVGSANWGRGIGWYLLAAAFCPQFDDPKLTHSLSVADYTQFPGCSENFDSSTALMFEIYKQSKDPNRKLSLDFIKPHILANGFVDDCSGDTYGLNRYSNTFAESELCNGLLLMLVSRFGNKYQNNETN